ncbi:MULTISPECIES: phosphate ABC transporter permease PstA [unclassified Nocardioides]|uniref:phosphate ABC transporter permease PstA n=1 Tax=unclassified Nocardioides TaxID=2615069 RepID=UPI0006F69463|nr:MULTISPECIES: phosphate ABC transporter permease PstA [unclassified Nocardioides]KQY56956.1 phosphate ABC transporter permease [Nocardioides sp. Root140]KQZ66844.1 phosphate ABC transporter permease [Nocardioides sp. Root151]KRF13077.1 phosphate ABC transporter permease [Nocardioides sp. Soil796]
MTHTEIAAPQEMAIRAGQLPRAATLLTVVFAVAIGGVAGMLLGSGFAVMVLLAWLVFLVSLTAWSTAVEGRRKATDRLVNALVWSTFAVAMMPLLSLLYTVIVKGGPVLTPSFLQSDMTGFASLGQGGGIYHAIMGTIMVTAIAAIIAIPVGLFTAIYLVEYSAGSRLAKVITFLVDVMTGIPSIVAGLFALSLFIVLTGDPLPRLGLGGGVALSLLMIPTVVRSVEEMLKLVPDDLREASYALGVPKWRTIVKVVLPTAVAGIVTGITLAIARVAGETAPLLLICGTFPEANWNPFSGAVQTLPVYIYSSLNGTTDAKYGDIWTDRVWGAALVLIIIVMALNLIARIIGNIFAPKTGR